MADAHQNPLERLEAMKDQARQGGGEARMEAQHAKGLIEGLQQASF